MRSLSFVWKSILLIWIGLICIGCGRTIGAEPIVADNLPALPTLEVETSIPVSGSAPYRELVVWVPPFFTASAEARQLVEEVVHHFERRNGSLHVSLYTKAETGRASLFAYLQQVQKVAPDLMPDLILLEEQELWQAAELELLVPFSDTELKAFSIPAATVRTTEYNGAVYGLPYALELEHLVYRTAQVAQSPRTWTDLLTHEARYLFAAGSPDGQNSDFLLAQYIGAGGQVNENGELLNPDALKSVFEFLVQANQAGIIPNPAINLASSDAVWTLFNTGDFELAHVPSSLYAPRRFELDEIAYAPMPTRFGESTAVRRAWSFAIVTREPEQRSLALSLLADLFKPKLQGEWSRLTYYLPTQPAAFNYWDQADPYHVFLIELMEQAVTLPKGRLFSEFLRSVHLAERNLLSNESAVEDAVSDLSQ